MPLGLHEYEYESWTVLLGDSKVYLCIPQTILEESAQCRELLATFCYFYVKRGLDSRVSFSVNFIADWVGRKRNRSDRGINARIRDAVARLSELGILELNGTPNNSGITEALVDIGGYLDEYFALVYLDELQRIFAYDGPTNKDAILEVFTWLRFHIPRRSNKAKAENAGVPVEDRQKELPECYNCFLSDIAYETKLAERTVSAAVRALNSLGLIYSEALPRDRIAGDTFRTSHTLFCNREKRERDMLLDKGSRYYLREVANKKAVLRRLSKRRKRTA